MAEKVLGVSKEIQERLDVLIYEKKAFELGKVKVPHFVISGIFSKEIQSRANRHIACFLKEHSLREFRSLDDLLEYKPKGTLKDIRRMFNDICASSVYTNSFKGVVSIDVSDLARNNIHDYQVGYFLERIRELSGDATFVIFYNPEDGRNAERLADEMRGIFERCFNIAVPPFSCEDYAQAIVDDLLARGIAIEDEDMIIEKIGKALAGRGKEGVGSIRALSDEVAFLVDYSTCIPVLRGSSISEGYQFYR